MFRFRPTDVLIYTFGLLLSGAVGFSPVLAQSLVITDCQGFTRAAKSVENGERSKVEIQIDESTATNPNVTATLTNQVTQEALSVTVSGGVASFEDLAPGIYALEISDPTAVAGLITLQGAGVGLLGASAAIAGAGVAVGGAVVGAVAVADEVDGGSNKEGATPAPRPTPQPGSPTPRPTATPMRPRPTPTPDDCPQCEPGLKPPPISSPFPADQLPRTTKAYTGKRPLLAEARRLSPYD